MAKIEKYVCDVCGVERGDANHWFFALRVNKKSGLGFHPWSLINQGFAPTWSDSDVCKDKVHLCGQDCAHKLLDQYLSGELK